MQQRYAELVADLKELSRETNTEAVYSNGTSTEAENSIETENATENSTENSTENESVNEEVEAEA